MNEHSDQTQPKSPMPLASGLLATIKQERESLISLCVQFERQLDALRERRQELLDEATNRTNEAVNALARLRQSRERQMRLLGRVLNLSSDQISLQNIGVRLQSTIDGDELGKELLDIRTRIRDQATITQQRCKDLEFALKYAVDLGRDLLQAVQGLDGPAPSKVYTSNGSPAQASKPRSFLNRVG